MIRPVVGSEHGWAGKAPDAKAWKGRRSRSRKAAAAEQDRAAGGPDRRWVALDDGRKARASVELKLLPRTRRIRAYLRWSDNGKSPARYLGEVHHSTRAENLTQGWAFARARNLLAEAESGSDSWAKNAAVRAVMRANRSRDTGPELRMRSLLHRAGLRYRVNTRPVPTLRRTADLVFSAARVAVFIDGCYWHGCPDHHRPSRQNSEFWLAKIAGNQARDEETNQALATAGWKVVRIWEHEDPANAAERVAEIVRGATSR